MAPATGPSFHPAVVLAVLGDLAALAMRVVRKADDLPVPHQVAVDVVPPLPRGDLHQGVLRRLGILRMDQPHEVGDAVYMGVYAHRRDAHRIRTDAGGGLPAHHRQGHELLRGARDDPSEIVAEDPAASDDGIGLLLRESCGTDELRHDAGIGIRYRVYGIVSAEQVVGRLAGVVVPGALGQNGRYQDMERIRGPLRIQSLRAASRIRSAQVLL